MVFIIIYTLAMQVCLPDIVLYELSNLNFTTVQVTLMYSIYYAYNYAYAICMYINYVHVLCKYMLNPSSKTMQHFHT